MAESPSFWSFAKAFRRHWFTLMSGGLSVPFAALSAISDSVSAKLSFAALALLAAGYAAYKIWSDERQLLIAAEARIEVLEAAADRRAERQRLLGEIGDLRTEMSRFRIEMERPESLNFHESVWENRFHDLERRIAEKINEFAGRGESAVYENRGNIMRTFGPNTYPHQLWIDCSVFDLNYLRDFITRHSSGTM
jgi:hypothetical protein